MKIGLSDRRRGDRRGLRAANRRRRLQRRRGGHGVRVAGMEFRLRLSAGHNLSKIMSFWIPVDN